MDKLVQIMESPVFSFLRLQLLEPDKHPYLFKSLYGILMLLPQSTAFKTLQNRLNCVHSMMSLYAPGMPFNPAPLGNGSGSSHPISVLRKKLSSTNCGGIDIRWTELVAHFKSRQLRNKVEPPTAVVVPNKKEELKKIEESDEVIRRSTASVASRPPTRKPSIFLSRR